jgi:hypothetical protein
MKILSAHFQFLDAKAQIKRHNGAYRYIFVIYIANAPKFPLHFDTEICEDKASLFGL